MLLRIRHGLLEVTNDPNTRKSAIIINNEIVISSGCILQPYVQPMLPFIPDNSNENVCASTKIIRRLQQCQYINAQDGSSEEAQYLKTLSYQVTFDRKKLPVANRQRQPQILTRYRAKLLYLFSSADISRNLHRLFSTGEDVGEHNKVLLSSFLILSMRTSNDDQETFERFIGNIGNYLRYLHAVRPLDDVLVMCTPFGMEHFYKTISIGKVSNIISRNNCLFALSNALPLGCEGAAVFNSKLRLIGIIICTSFQRQQENVNLTLAANFGCLLRDFMQQLDIKIISTTLPREPTNFAWERTLLVIEDADVQGTGIFVRVKKKKFILTCSHVIFKAHSKVTCRYAAGEFESEVLWRNPEYNRAFDVALLTAPSHIPDRCFVRLSSAKPVLGQMVYNAGFPYFVNFNLKYDFNPSIFQGRIIKFAPGAIMSDGCVQAGQSGGPMFDEGGCLLGIIVSNIRIGNVIYPNINTAVPILNIRSTLEKYAQTNDPDVLNNLVADREIQRVWTMETPSVLSKL